MVTSPLSIISDANNGYDILSFIKRVIFHSPISMTVAVTPVSRAPTMLQATQSSPSPIVCPVWTEGGGGQSLTSTSQDAAGQGTRESRQLGRPEGQGASVGMAMKWALSAPSGLLKPSTRAVWNQA